VDTTTDGSGRVADLTLAQLKRLDAGIRFDPAFAGERIPTLEEVLEAVGNRLLLNVELKTTSLRDNGLEQAVIAQVRQHSLDNRVLFSSFNPFSLQRAKRITPHILAGLLTPPYPPVYGGGQGGAWMASSRTFPISWPASLHHPRDK
jgi:glycerophosphoryl diester phosphodiesterase